MDEAIVPARGIRVRFDGSFRSKNGGSFRGDTLQADILQTSISDSDRGHLGSNLDHLCLVVGVLMRVVLVLPLR